MKILKLVLIAALGFLTLNSCSSYSSQNPNQTENYGTPYDSSKNSGVLKGLPSPSAKESRIRVNAGTGANSVTNGGGTSVGQ